MHLLEGPARLSHRCDWREALLAIDPASRNSGLKPFEFGPLTIPVLCASGTAKYLALTTPLDREAEGTSQ